MPSVLVLFLLLATSLIAENLTVRVVSVHDADTIVVLRNGRAETIRLKGIECSENRDGRAKKYASEKIQGKNVLLKIHGTDRYGRTVADVFLQNGNLFNRELVRTGNCRWGRSRAMRDE